MKKVRIIRKQPFKYATATDGTITLEGGMVRKVPDDIAAGWIQMKWAEEVE